MTLEMGIAAALLLLLLAIVGFQLLKGGAFFGAEANKLELLASARSCQSTATLGATFFDNDYGDNKGDTFPDGCDLCKGGDDAKDTDRDGIPDACDDNPDLPYERKTKLGAICKNAKTNNVAPECYNPKPSWDEGKRQCTLACYGKRHARI